MRVAREGRGGCVVTRLGCGLLLALLLGCGDGMELVPLGETQHFRRGDPFRVISSTNPLRATRTYLCTSCEEGDFERLVPPPGFEKSPVWRLEASAAVLEKLPEDATFVGFVADGGLRFQHDARSLAPPLLGGASFPCGYPLLGGDSCGAIVSLESDRTFTWRAGDTLHALNDGSDVFVLYASRDVEDLDALRLPPGWRHSERVLAEALVVDSEGYLEAYADLAGNLWQRLDAGEREALRWRGDS